MTLFNANFMRKYVSYSTLKGILGVLTVHTVHPIHLPRILYNYAPMRSSAGLTLRTIAPINCIWTRWNLCLMTTVVKPLLKKPSLDKELLLNYHPISNLSFLSKLSERVVLSRLKGYLTSNNLLNLNQSAYTKHHSTETLLTSLYNKLVTAIGHQQVSCLCLLDISAAFDTIDHTILTHRLSSLFGIFGNRPIMDQVVPHLTLFHCQCRWSHI